MEEIWKDIPNFPNYQISNLGKVYSKKRNKLLAITKNDRGYCYVQLWKSGKGYLFRLHRLVAQAFIPNPNNYPEINHKDGNKENNCINNLEWCDRLYNITEAYKNGLIPPPKANRTSFKIGNKPKNCIKVNQYDLQGNLINTYFSISEASRNTSYSVMSIARYCKGTRKCKEYVWKYVDK